MILGVASLILGLSAFIQGAVGFGFSLVAVPLLALLMPLKEIVPMMVLFSLVLNIMVWVQLQGHVDKKKMALLISMGLIFIPLGIYSLKILPESLIQISVGLLVILAALGMLADYKIHFRNPYVAFALTGALSGILNGSTSLSGPPVILMLSNDGMDKAQFRKTLATYFMTLNLFSLPMFLAGGMVNRDLLFRSASLLPGVFVGVLIGIKFGNRLKENVFRSITLVLILVMGVMTILSGLS